jgi:hypothetical protein
MFARFGETNPGCEVPQATMLVLLKYTAELNPGVVE